MTLREAFESPGPALADDPDQWDEATTRELCRAVFSAVSDGGTGQLGSLHYGRVLAAMRRLRRHRHRRAVAA